MNENEKRNISRKETIIENIDKEKTRISGVAESSKINELKENKQQSEEVIVAVDESQRTQRGTDESVAISIQNDHGIVHIQKVDDKETILQKNDKSDTILLRMKLNNSNYNHDIIISIKL